MSTELVERMQTVQLEPKEETIKADVSNTHDNGRSTVTFKVAGMTTFDLELDLAMPVRDVKKIVKEKSNIEPEHMRLIFKDAIFKDADTFEGFDHDCKLPVQVFYTAGHTALMGGTKAPAKNRSNPFVTPVRGLPGSKGDRPSRVSGRRGGMGIIRKYGILMKRQEFREKAEEIGFRKYR